jgi:hypothetical protein
MRAILFLIGGVIVANIAWATFVWRPSAEEKPASVVNTATRRGQEPWMTNEKHIDAARSSARRSLLAALDKPWSTLCSDAGHQQLVKAIGYYYWQRGSQTRSYARNWGEPGRQHIRRAWATSDDNRVERRVRESFARGHFVLEEVHPESVRAYVAEQVRGERAGANACAG